MITTIHPPLDVRIYERELKSMVEAGLSVCLICPWEKPAEADGLCSWVSLPEPKTRAARVVHAIRTFRSAMKVDARIYLFHDLDFLVWAVLLRTFKGRPVVYDCHENYPEEVYTKPWIPRWLRRPLSWLVRVVEDASVRRLDAVVAVAPHQMNRFTRVGTRTVLVRNFSKLPPLPDLPHERALICSGSLSEDYGAHVLLEIGRELRRRSIALPIVVVDRFGLDKALRRRFLEAIEKEGLPIRVEREVPPGQIAWLLSKGCIGVAVEVGSPNKRLGYPTKLFEYMAAGLPIIASDLPLAREVVEGAKCGVVVPPGDAKAYVSAALELLENPERFERLRQNGLNAARSMYTWAGEAGRLLALIKCLLQSDHGEDAAAFHIDPAS